MNRSTQWIFLGLIVLSATASAQVKSDDKVSIRYLPGYPPPDRSTEWLELRVERMGSPAKGEEQEIDHFFAAVEETLTKYGVDGDWQAAIPDAPSIEITIVLKERQVKLTSAHVSLERSGKYVVTERGGEPLNGRTRDAVLSQQSEAFRQHRLAFERLLELALDRARAEFSP